MQDAPKMSWIAGNVVPVVPMYWPPGDPSGTLATIFFTTPVAQKGSFEFGHADWETPALVSFAMCQNWCNSECHWNTDVWATMHIYFNSGWKTWTCPDAETSGIGALVGRSCPNGEKGSYTFTWPERAEQVAENAGFNGQGSTGTTDSDDNNNSGNAKLAGAALFAAAAALGLAVVGLVKAKQLEKHTL